VKFVAAAILTVALAVSVAACRDTSKLQGGSGSEGNAATGRTLFTSKACITCHTLAAVNSTGTIGPHLDHIATTAATRKSGMTAAQYIDESIRDPGAFVVEGFPAPNAGGMMLPVPVSDQERKDLVAFLMTQQ
jgi:cytochrome c oxidase subunit 2